jgi:hypothetical protein
MTTQIHNQFTLLHEDDGKKILHEFQAICLDDVIQSLISFLMGCGYSESSIHETMQEITEMYVEAEQGITLPLQQDTLKVA